MVSCHGAHTLTSTSWSTLTERTTDPISPIFLGAKGALYSYSLLVERIMCGSEHTRGKLPHAAVYNKPKNREEEKSYRSCHNNVSVDGINTNLS